MNNKSLFLLAVLATSAHAESFRYSYTLSAAVPYDWETIDPTYTDWTNTGSPHSCSNWSPSPSSVGKGVAFEQTATDCQQDQTRSVQPRQKDSRTGKIENSGAAYTVQRSVAVTESRDSVGILENWSAFTPTYTDWVNSNALYGCTNWSPDPSIYKTSTTFTQSSSTCKTDQERQRQEREQEKYTSEIRNSGSPVTEEQTLTGQSASRNYSVVLGTWNNDGAITSCSNWSPDPSTQTINTTFTQTATDCVQAQKRSRDESYVDHRSGSTVPVSSTTESQAVTASNTRSAIGTKETWVATTSTYTAWTNTNAVYGCTAWSPSPSNYTVQTQFTQTGTGCSVDQQRTRQDRETETTTGAVRNSGSAVTESQTIGGQTSSRSYLMDFSGWSDSGSYYNCSAYTPDVSTVDSGTSFTQTATCSINQTRGAAGYIYNNGWVADPAVPYRTETQVISRSVSQTAVGTKSTQVCRLDASNYFYQHYSGRDKDVTWDAAYWDGVLIYNQQDADKYPSVKYNGYTYTAPDGMAGTTHRTICRN